MMEILVVPTLLMMKCSVTMFLESRNRTREEREGKDSCFLYFFIAIAKDYRHNESGELIPRYTLLTAGKITRVMSVHLSHVS
jgi:hypothetical protein